MPFVRAGGLTVHYDYAGPDDTPAVLLVNALGTNFHLWDENVGALRRSHRVLRYDMRGQGLTDSSSGNDQGDATIERLANDALALLDATGIRSATIVGSSIGGMVAQHLGALHPERVDGLVLCATANRLGPPAGWDARIEIVERDGLGAITDAAMGRWFTSGMHAVRPDVVRGFANMLRRTPVDGYVAGCRAVRDADLRAADTFIRARTLVIAGGSDEATTPAMAGELQQAIRGAESVVMVGGHMFTAERPDEFNRIVLEFLEGR